MGYISKEGLEKLKEELNRRRTIVRQEIAERLEEAKSMGDLSENSEYTAAKESQAFNEGRVLELEEVVKKAVLIKPARGQAQKEKKVQIGSVVEVMPVGASSKKRVFMIVGSQETDPAQGKISNESPLGQTFLDRKIGDIIETNTPKGTIKYKIVGIE
ncbi:MAG: transcription elongation factor GreA [Patescibacteria group bacterium]|nr:transcription elongation factor GreA [Patescibacteria group bacterium]